MPQVNMTLIILSHKVKNLLFNLETNCLIKNVINLMNF